MNTEPDIVATTALDWVIRVDRDDFVDWEQLTAWLEADPRHALAYTRLQARNREPVNADVAKPVPSPTMDARRRRSLERRFLPLAASLVLVTGLGAAWLWRDHLTVPDREREMAFATQPGELRSVVLADGTRIDLAGSTRLSIAGGGRRATLDMGRALFAVVHDPGRPFAVRVGGQTVTDVGTVFDIRTRPTGFDLAVGEGAVRLTDGKVPLTVRAGAGVHVRGETASPMTENKGEVGGWLAGRYSYADATISSIASDIEGATGAHIVVAPDVAGRHFAGTLHFTRDAASTLNTVAPVLGLAVQRHGATWALKSAADDQRP